MTYRGWDNREYEDLEMDAMRRDAKEHANEGEIDVTFEWKDGVLRLVSSEWEGELDAGQTMQLLEYLYAHRNQILFGHEAGEARHDPEKLQQILEKRTRAPMNLLDSLNEYQNVYLESGNLTIVVDSTVNDADGYHLTIWLKIPEQKPERLVDDHSATYALLQTVLEMHGFDSDTVGWKPVELGLLFG
jgi:hypothetical protein